MSLEVTSSYLPLLSRGSSFKMKKMNLMSNLKILTEKFITSKIYILQKI